MVDSDRQLAHLDRVVVPDNEAECPCMESVCLSGRSEPNRTLVCVGRAFEFPGTLEDVGGLKRTPCSVLARFLRGVERVQVEGSTRERVDRDVPEVLVVMSGHAAFPSVGEQVLDREEPAEAHRCLLVPRSFDDGGRALFQCYL